MSLLTFILTTLLLAAPDALSFDSLSYDFGSQPKSVESLTHTFKFTNTSSSSVRISYALATCSCTKISWTRESVPPGGQGAVTAVYNREFGANSFEKLISVFVDGVPKPNVLRIAGSFYETKEVLGSEFPVSRGPLGFNYSPIDLGNVCRGSQVQRSFWAANLSSDDIKVEFADLSDGLDIYTSDKNLSPSTRKEFHFSIDVDTTSWGLRHYYATPVVNGKQYQPVSFDIVAIEDYSSLSSSEKNAAPRPILVDKNCNFGTVRRGAPAQAAFRVRNSSSDEPLRIRAVYSDSEGADISAPSQINPGQTAEFNVSLAPSSLVRGSNTVTVFILSSSPIRQILEVYITGNVD